MKNIKKIKTCHYSHKQKLKNSQLRYGKKEIGDIMNYIALMALFQQ